MLEVEHNTASELREILMILLPCYVAARCLHTSTADFIACHHRTDKGCYAPLFPAVSHSGTEGPQLAGKSQSRSPVHTNV